MPCPQVDRYQKQLAPQAAALEGMTAQLAAQDKELMGGMSALVALKRQVRGGERGGAVLCWRAAVLLC